MRSIRWFWMLSGVLIMACTGMAQSPVVNVAALQGLKTVAEESLFEATSTESDVQQFLKTLAQAAPTTRLDSIGVTNEGRPLHALIIGRPLPGERQIDLPLPPNDARLTIVIIGNIHSGECDGKEALLALMRDVLLEMPKNWEERLVLAIIPNFNADANERVGMAHRPGQVGPTRGMGLRENAQNLDLNRDFIKLQSPEVRSLVRALDQWNADAFIDCHTTNGSLHRYPLTYDIPHNPACYGKLLEWLRDRYLPEVTARLSGQGLDTFYYGNFDADHKKWETFGHEPRYSTEYMGMRGRIGILVESYSYATYKERIDATYAFVRECLTLLAERSDEVKQFVRDADQRFLVGGSKPKIPLSAELYAKEEVVAVKGYGYAETDNNSDRKNRRFPNPADKGRIAELKKVDYPLRVWNLFKPKLEVEPAAGYLIPPQLAWAVERLMLHGIHVYRIEDTSQFPHKAVSQWIVRQVVSQPFQGLTLTKLTVEDQAENPTLLGPCYWVPTNQPLGMLASYILEPRSEENLATWGFLDGYLVEGQPYPIFRCNDFNVKLQSERMAEPPKTERLSLEGIFKPGAMIGLTNQLPTELRWLNKSTEYLIERGGSWTAVDAASGSMRPWEPARGLMESLASVEAFKSQVDRRSALKLDNFDREYSKAIVDFKQDLYLYDHAQKQTQLLTSSPDKAERLAELSPNGTHVAFVRDNNLWVIECQSKTEKAVTHNGSEEILNGMLDWVYQEEVYGRGKFKAFWWSPDGKRLAFLRLDQTPVARYQIADSLSFSQNLEETRYPISGAPNPHVSLMIYDVSSGKTIEATLNDYPVQDRILCRVDWHPDSQRVCVQVQNRIQSWLDLVECDVADGQCTRLFREEGPAWIDVTCSPQWLPEGDFLWLSDLPGGRRHLFRVSADGQQRTALTAGHWDAAELLSISQDGKWAWLLGNPDGATQVQLIKVATDGSQWQQVTKEAGTHRVTMHPTGQFFADIFSSIDQPPRVSIHDATGKLLRVVGMPTIDRFRSLELSSPRYFTIQARDGQLLHSMLISPPDVDLHHPTKKYPVLIHVYGGPGNATVKQAWQSPNYWWHQYLAQQGIFVLLCDNRSALGKGNADTWRVYKELGKVEMQDLEDAVGWLKEQAWANPDRIGLWGWSFGGYLTAYAMTHSQLFHAGVSGAPVTDWRNYDSIYTERYMSTPDKNPSGYLSSSVVEAAGNLHGRLMLIHGEIDENVHISNTMQLVHRLQKEGKDFDLMIYPKNRHGVVDPNQRYHLYRTMTEFFRRHLLD